MRSWSPLVRIAGCLIEDAFRWMMLQFRSTQAVLAENLFLRHQLALYMERGVKPHRIDAATRASLVVLSQLFDWRSALVVVQAGNLDSLASRRLEAAVAGEVATGSTSDTRRAARSDSQDRERELPVG